MFSSNEFTYRVNLKKSNNWQRYDRARLGISVGKPNHEGEKFTKTLEWVNARFKHIEVRVSDTLQRFNMPGLPEDNLEICRAAGQAWVERNRSALERFPHIMLYHWDSLLADPALPIHQAILEQKMADPTFQTVFEQDVTTHVAKTGKDPERCRAFMKEEFSVFHMQHEQRPAADIYPGSFFLSSTLLRDDLAQVRIDFNRVPIANSNRAIQDDTIHHRERR